MTVKMPISFPIFPTPPLSPNRRWSTTVIRFSRWNNANAEPFNRLLRTQQHIEHDLRLSRRYNSADGIVIDEDVSVSSSLPFRSVGTPSIPSRPSIPGRKSKYSKNRAADVAVRYSRRGDDDVESKGRWGSGGERRRFPDDDLVSRRSRDGDDDVADNAAEELLKYSENRQSRGYGNRFGNDDMALESRSEGSGGERGQLGDDDVAEHAPEESYGNRFRDDDVAEDMRFRGHGGGDDVAVSGSRSSNYSTSAEERESGQVDVAGKSYYPAFLQFSNADVAGNNRLTNSVGNRARGENADVAINRRFNNSVEQRGGGRGADVAENPSKHLRNLKPSHPAFRRFRNSVEKREDGGEEGVRVMEDGVSYMVGGAPFEFMYSYTETPKVKPVRLREPPVAPFGPTTMARPWTGRKPLAKKTLPEFDSFKLPPPHKKGVKPVQSPGPFLPGSGPKYVHSREEILGEPLSKKEIEELVNGCRKSRRQMHMGRDGLTHNMLENIHAHWKRRRLCKIKCLGVCTVDMDNVRQQLEEKTGGKVIYGSGGVLYLFRGRNYNYKTRPRYPLMLWKPITPVYPRLVQRIPDGLTLEEASLMRKKGRDLIPICKLGKNGVYSNLVKDVREAFEACDIVRINCQGLNSSDYHKIGAKLKDLVPCILLSFEREHILMWRGKEWTPSLPKLGETPQIENSEFEVTLSSTSDSEDEGVPTSFFSDSEDEKEENVEVEGSITEEDNSKSAIVLDSLPETNVINENEISTDVDDHARNNIELSSLWTKGVQLLLKEAIDNGAAVILDNSNLDSDIVFQTALSLAKSAPRGPVFKDKRRKTVVKKPEKEKAEDLKVEEVLMIEDNNRENTKRNGYRREMVLESVKADYTNKVPQGSLRVDELAKLLA